MLVHAKAPFIRGCLLLISFLALFGIMLMPLMKDELGNHMTGLQYADNVFNELSKGSSYFIPGVRNSVKTVEGKSVQLTVKLKKADLAALAGADGFAHLDADLIRVIEDVVDVLIDRGLLRLTDLPLDAQRKLLARKGARARLREGLDLLSPNGVI